MQCNYEELIGKKILLIALSGYPKGMIEEMQRMGMQVDYICDKPNEGFWCKTLGRLQIGFYQKVLDKYYYNEIDRVRNNKYDFILVIRGEYTTHNALKRLRSVFPNAKMVLYIWDGLHKQNTKGIEDKWEYFDKVLTFDRIDYEDNKERIGFLPLFYYNSFLPNEDDNNEADKDYKYDVCFIGTGHADRIKVINSIVKQCKEHGLKCYVYFYLPHLMVYYYNKLFNKDYKGVSVKEINFKMLPFQKVYNTYADSKCIVDVENPGQHGLTMRSIETIGLKRKFITTNADIINYDFYNNANIQIVDRNNPMVDYSFFEKSYCKLSEDIYKKYSLNNWIFEVLS